MTAKKVHMLFTDLKGITRDVAYFNRSDKAPIGKTDGSSSYGFGHIEDSDLELIPDPEVQSINIGASEEYQINLSYVYKNGSALEQDPRRIAKSLESSLQEAGYRSLVAGELEFFVFDNITASVKTVDGKFQHRVEIDSIEFKDDGRYQNKNSYMLPLNGMIDKLTAIVSELWPNIDVEVLHHEVASSQYELNVRPKSVKEAADCIILSKYLLRKELAGIGRVPIFIPKPIPYDNGSGLHTNISLWRDDRNMFYDENDSYAKLSQTGRYFIGGILEHGRSLSAIVSPTVNSYRRLIPGFEAPVNLVWGRSNRSAALRVPFSKGQEKERIEYRPPDPSSNPYLAFTAVIAAGLDGIIKKISPGDPKDMDVYKLSPDERKGIKTIPGSLTEALDELETDNEFLSPYFGRSTISNYIDIKRKEVERAAPVASAVEVLDAMNI
ncbi:MAG: type I glutamate--ammonia ligase [Candidatus Parvarchaeota archaeon]|nr:type I glutamate--ammonia ligase [Candidatus Parvarchaeota archaeon]